MENQNWNDILSNPNASYIHSLLLHASFASNYRNISHLHPSEPNYIWLEAGTNRFPDVTFKTDDDPGTLNTTGSQEHLVTKLIQKGIAWKAYVEDSKENTCPRKSSGYYAVKHNPFMFFKDVTENNVYCVSHIRPLRELFTDLKEEKTPQYAFIVPNLCNDMHNTCSPFVNNVKQGDFFLSQTVPAILASKTFQENGFLFITWDESENGDYPIGLITLSPFAKGGGYTNTLFYTHSSLLRTIEDIFGITTFLGESKNAQNLQDLFKKDIRVD
jgi:hypothetical protein